MTAGLHIDEAIIWHDLECHAYQADLPLWRELAASAGGPILDVGAGTGRVTLDLVAAGHDVVALDLEPSLLAALSERAPRPVETVAADAEDFALGRTFALIVVPMQTVQLLTDRPAFLTVARGHLRPGGLLAIAIADVLEAFDPGTPGLPLPDVAEHDGWRFASQPLALRPHDASMRLERTRTSWSPTGARTVVEDSIDLAILDGATLEAEGRAAGLSPQAARVVAPTDEHIGSRVVLLRA